MNDIEFVNVNKTYDGGIEGVKDISLTIEKEEFVFFVGTSGSGKSTLIKLLMKEIDVTSGEIYIQQRNITKLRQGNIPYFRRELGVVFQDFRLLPNKTVFENVAFAMRVIGESPRTIRRNVPMVLSMVGLQNKSKSYPGQLSGGEQQRVSLARAIINNPPILLADEPTGNLDPSTAWEIISLLNDINKRGTTIVVATHAKELVDAMQKRVVGLKNGNIIRDDKIGFYNQNEVGYEVEV